MVEEAQRAYILSQVNNVNVSVESVWDSTLMFCELWSGFSLYIHIHAYFVSLPQGPLRNTCGHFWLMIWEQCSKAVIMLNRVIEKGSVSTPQHLLIIEFLLDAKGLQDMFEVSYYIILFWLHTEHFAYIVCVSWTSVQVDIKMTKLSVFKIHVFIMGLQAIHLY